ncbi:MAG: patatin-like phospholipase family protein [Nocardioides sp.]
MTKTGLVLGGGGVTGIAWEIGLLAGLREGGADVSGADVVIGTSAGSVVGAVMASGEDLDHLYAEQTTPPGGGGAAVFGTREAVTLLALMLLPGNGRTKRRRIGQAALKAHPEPAHGQVEVFASRLRLEDGTLPGWPERDLRITAVDADSGSFTVFDKSGDADLVHAIAASCAVPLVWPPVEIGGRRYVDGGMRSAANADIAEGCDVVLAVVPLWRAFARRHALPEQLRRTGARKTAWIAPDKASLEAIGSNVLDPSKRMGAARAGREQGLRMAAEVAEGWPATR